ncbi:MAG: DRTGG domain-containing protein [Ignavibacteria bacterium]|nr:DRTGG domain-containing protein [Ignavibacteria bacterium]
MRRGNMQLKEIKEILNCTNHTDDGLLEKEISYCYATDMMSDVLKSCKTGSLLITGLVNQQVIQVAEIMDLSGIIFVSGKKPSEEMLKGIESKNIPLLSTDLHMFEACGILYSKGLKQEVAERKNENGK